MPRTTRSVLIWLLAMLIGLQGIVPLVSAQDVTPTPEELDQLLAPVALYPDALLSQITTASTNPQEILDVNAWLEQSRDLAGPALIDAAERQGFDPAFLALVNFPQVLEMMAQHIDDYAAIGRVFSTDQGAVAASIQRLRAQAYDSGALRSNPQQTVGVQQSAGQTVYVIQPANPTVVYVPQYDPTIVYVRPAPSVVATSLISFHMGIGIGALVVDRPWGWGGWGWNWGARSVYYNHGYWGGWARPYHPPHRWYRPRPIVWGNRPGYRGNWGYRPPHYRPPYRPAPRPSHPGDRPPAHRPMPSRPATPHHPVRPNPPAKPAPGRPSAQPNKPGTPNRPPSQPSRSGTPNDPDRNPSRPNPPRDPNGNKPTHRGQPSGMPNRPGTPNQPGTKPSRPDRSDSGGKNPDNGGKNRDGYGNRRAGQARSNRSGGPQS
jgi:hypothetical protein